MEANQALGVLIQAAELANKRGAFTLQESSAIAQAVAIFQNPQPTEASAPVEGTPAPKEAKKVKLQKPEQAQ